MKLSPGLPRLHYIGRFCITRYWTLRTNHKPQEQTYSNNKYSIWNFDLTFHFQWGKESWEVRKNYPLVSQMSHCLYLNKEVRTEGPLGPVTPTSSAAVPAAALFELLMCLTTDLHSTLPCTRCFRFSKHICAESHKAWLVKCTHSPPWHSFLLSELVTCGGAAGV